MTEKFVRLCEIGRGTFGTAWLARSSDTGDNCVIKVIELSRMSKKELDLCVTEVAVLSHCQHRNIICYLESFSHDRTLNIVMEYACGGDLQRKIQQQKGIHFSREVVLDWFVQICLALEYIHDMNILHRDLKTQNIFLTSSGTVKLGDFGIARILRDKNDHAITTIGTPFYISPEICQKKAYNTRTDMWSAGCVLYEMCLLRVPFDAPEFTGLVLTILRGRYTPIPRHFGSVIPHLVKALLHTNPAARPSATEVLNLPGVSGVAETHRRLQEQFAVPKEQQSFSQKRHGSSKKCYASPNQRHVSPNQRHASPNQRHVSPNQRHVSPKKYYASPNQRHVSPNQRHASPNQRHASPKQHPAFQKDQRTQDTHLQQYKEHARKDQPHRTGHQPHDGQENSGQNNRDMAGRRKQDMTGSEKRHKTEPKPKDGQTTTKQAECTIKATKNLDQALTVEAGSGPSSKELHSIQPKYSGSISHERRVSEKCVLSDKEGHSGKGSTLRASRLALRVIRKEHERAHSEPCPDREDLRDKELTVRATNNVDRDNSAIDQTNTGTYSPETDSGNKKSLAAVSSDVQRASSGDSKKRTYSLSVPSCRRLSLALPRLSETVRRQRRILSLDEPRQSSSAPESPAPDADMADISDEVFQTPGRDVGSEIPHIVASRKTRDSTAFNRCEARDRGVKYRTYTVQKPE